MKRSAIVIIFLLVIGSCSLLGQSAKSSMRIDIIKYSSYFDDVEIEYQITAQNYTVPSRTFEHFRPNVSLLDAQDETRILFNEDVMFFSINKSDVTKGKFVVKQSIKVQKESFFLGTDKYKLRIKLKGISDEVWSMDSKEFTLTQIQSSLEKKIVAPAVNASNKKVVVGDRAVQISFKYFSNYNIEPEICTQLYFNNQPCASISKVIPTSNTADHLSITIPYTNINLPKGNHRITYKIWAQKDGRNIKELYQGVLNIVQPQLYWLVFETKNANIDVSGLDKGFQLSQMFSKSAGRGYGDACFSLWNKGELLFASKVASNSGLIPKESGRVQTYLNEKVFIKFMDKDFFNSDFIEMYAFDLNSKGRQVVHVKNKGRIENFELYYTLMPVTEQNYKLNK